MGWNRSQISRRSALKCLAYGGAGTLFTLSGGVLTPFDLAQAAHRQRRAGRSAAVPADQRHAYRLQQGSQPRRHRYPERRPSSLPTPCPRSRCSPCTPGTSRICRSRRNSTSRSSCSADLRTGDLHTVPGEHDTTDPAVSEYFSRFGKASGNRGYYSFDHGGVHFLALINVLQFKPGGLGTLGDEQLAWAIADLKARTASTPIVVFAHMPLWTIYEPWGWGTGDAEPLRGAAAALRLGHHAQRPHPPDRAEGRGQHHLPHGALDGLSAAGGRRRRRPRTAHGARAISCPRCSASRTPPW